MAPLGYARFLGDLKFWRGTPETFEVVVTPGLLAEDVHDKPAKIEQSPLGRAISFAVSGRAVEMLFELLFHFGADGLHLRGAETCANHEIVREGTHARSEEHTSELQS